jgi:hypothetical protein
MIKLFRNLRKKLLSENKTQRYFKYALGEIILVVIGILIALQINTWNEKRKAINEEAKILTALQNDFKVSKTRIEDATSVQKRVLDYSKVLIEIYENKNDKTYEYFDTHLDSLDFLIGYGTSFYRAEPVTGAYNALISAGKVDLIKNETLRHLLAQFSADLESGFEDHDIAMDLLIILTDQVSDFSLKTASNKFRKQFNLQPRKHDTLIISKKFFNNDSYFGNLYYKLALEKNRYNRQQSMLKQSDSILSLINRELKK